MKKLLAILSVVLFANQASAWEVFGLNENTKLEDLEIFEESYNERLNVFDYTISPPKPVAIGNEYQINYSKKHGVCSVTMDAVRDKPYPYGKTILSRDDFTVAFYNDWQKLPSIMFKKYGKEDDFFNNSADYSKAYIWNQWNDKIKQHGFRFISLSIPTSQDYGFGWLTYVVDSPGCTEGAQKDAAEQNAESIGVSSDDF